MPDPVMPTMPMAQPNPTYGAGGPDSFIRDRMAAAQTGMQSTAQGQFNNMNAQLNPGQAPAQAGFNSQAAALPAAPAGGGYNVPSNPAFYGR